MDLSLHIHHTHTHRWAMTSVVRRFLACRVSSASMQRRSFSLSSAAVASSSSRMAGSEMHARAMAMRCFCPPERLTEPSSTLFLLYYMGMGPVSRSV